MFCVTEMCCVWVYGCVYVFVLCLYIVCLLHVSVCCVCVCVFCVCVVKTLTLFVFSGGHRF